MNHSHPPGPLFGRRRFVQLLASMPFVSGTALAQTMSLISSAAAMTTAQRPIRPKALVFDMHGTVLDFYDPMMRELARIPTVASHVRGWSTFAGQWSTSAHDAIVEISAGRKAWQPNGAVYADESDR